MIMRTLGLLLPVTLFLGCAGRATSPEAPQGPAPTSPPAAAAATAAPVADEAPAAAAPRWKSVDTDPQPGEGKDFTKQAQALYRVLACGPSGDVPEPFDAATVDEYCKRLRVMMQGYRDNYLSKAQPFFDKIRPKDLPPSVVYPFGGGDLLSALTVYPDAQEITTISLEHAGDPRLSPDAKHKQEFAEGLKLLGTAMSTLLKGDWNWTRNMEATQRAEIPEQVAYALMALVVHSKEPLSLRYFKINRDGSLDYLDEQEIDKAEGKQAKHLREWGAPDWSKAFSNMELRFTDKKTGQVQVFRHVAANLADSHITGERDHLTKDPGLIAHLEAKGRVSALTRAAAHLLWKPNFSEIRNYLMRNLEWMPSDSTGIPPEFAKEAGLVQETYGKFETYFKPSDQGDRETRHDDAFRQLFNQNPPRELGFRFGYPDNNKNAHLVVTRRP